MKSLLVAFVSILLVGTAFAQENAQPSTPPPTQQPPAPPSSVPPPPQQEAEAAPAAPAPTNGQWVYTQQYGWLWMPYGDQYTYEPGSEDAEPYAYVYYPSYGWSWLAAPWVWGWGVSPY